jgi:hypothetical protein
LEAYVLDTLDADTQAAVAKHLSECADCRRLADEYVEIASRLPEAVAAVSPVPLPESVKARLFQTIEAPQPSRQSDPRSVRETPTRRRLPLGRIRFQQVGTFVSLVLLIFSLVWIIHLNTALAHEQGLRESLESQTELIFEVVDSDQTTRHFLQATENAPHLPDAAPPYGKVFIRADLPYVISMTGRLPPPPAGQVYNLWLFSEGGTQLAGTMMPDDAGFGTLLYQASENGPLYESAQLVLQDENSSTPSGVPVLMWRPSGEN